MSEVRIVSDSDFESAVLQSTLPVLVDFWAPWCGPCKRLAPIVAEVAAAHADRLAVVSLDIDASPDTAQRYDIVSVPTLAVFEAGELVHRFPGRSKQALLTEIAPYLA